MSRRKNKSLIKRTAIDIAGFGLVIISPFLGWLPGPGGIPIFLAGVAILARNYDWADNLLKNFDKYRIEFTNKYLMNNKKIARTIDALSVFIMLLAIFIVVYANGFLRFASIGMLFFGLFIIVSNQKRLDRIIKKLKN